MAKRNNNMDNLDVICIGAAIVDIPLQPVSKNIFDVDCVNFYVFPIDNERKASIIKYVSTQ